MTSPDTTEAVAKALVAAATFDAPEEARVAIAADRKALAERGYAIIIGAELIEDLESHADGNPGDGCWDLHDKWKARLGGEQS